MSSLLTTTLVTSACILVFGVGAFAASLYGILVWHPRHRQERVEALKTTGRQGVATILEIQEAIRPSHVRRAVFIRTPIRLKIDVPGIEPYEVNRILTVPSHAMDLLAIGKIVPVWVDPQEPRNLDKIAINLE